MPFQLPGTEPEGQAALEDGVRHRRENHRLGRQRSRHRAVFEVVGDGEGDRVHVGEPGKEAEGEQAVGQVRLRKNRDEKRDDAVKEREFNGDGEPERVFQLRQIRVFLRLRTTESEPEGVEEPR